MNQQRRPLYRLWRERIKEAFNSKKFPEILNVTHRIDQLSAQGKFNEEEIENLELLAYCMAGKIGIGSWWNAYWLTTFTGKRFAYSIKKSRPGFDQSWWLEVSV